MFERLKNRFPSESLMGRILRGGRVLAAGGLVENILRFMKNIILARLLAPEDFGLMATLAASVAALEAMAEVGLRQAVIQNRNGAEEGFINIVWWLSSLRGLGLYIIAFAAAPFIGSFFDKPESAHILRIGFLTILMNGLMSPRVNVLQKELRFTRWVLIMKGAGVMGILTGVVSAFYLRNVWALVLAFLTEASLRTIFSFVFYPIRPKLRIERKFLGDIRTFSQGMFGLPVLMMLFVQADVFVIGKVLSLDQLGLYVLAKSLADFPNTVISKTVQPLILPSLALMQKDERKLKEILLTLTRIVATFGIPLVAFLALFSEPILSLAYGPRYGTAALPFSVLCVATLIFICTSVIMNIYIAVGKPHIQRNAALLRTGLFLILIYPAVKTMGLFGASCAVLLATFSSLAVQTLYLQRLIHLEMGEYLGRWIVGVKLSLFVIVPGIIVRLYIGGEGYASVGTGLLLCMMAWGLGILNPAIIKRNPIWFRMSGENRVDRNI